MEFMIEDTLKIANEVAKEGYKVYMPEGPNNEKGQPDENVIKVKNLKEIIEILKI